MGTFKINFRDEKPFNASFRDENAYNASFGEVQRVQTTNYEDLYNKPIEYDTTEAWNSQPTLIAKKGHIYFYTDYKTIEGVKVAGAKFGDGTSYLVDLPFMDANFEEHIADHVRHITQEEREFWNNKNRALITGENLILTAL